jgi:hypothetical protein
MHSWRVTTSYCLVVAVRSEVQGPWPADDQRSLASRGLQSDKLQAGPPPFFAILAFFLVL